MVVSHDTEFLDSIVTDIIHYENRKLVYYHGSLSSFVSTHPEARHYYDLDASQMIFKFPAPGRLDGIASATKTIVKLDNVTFTYPGAVSPAIKNVSVKLCLSSRVAVVGPNGAGKSTLIKLLVQELEPNKDENGVSCGEIWKHPNLRIAYVAQHSFFHVEQHLDISPVDYFKWRFDQGVDKESMSKSNVQMTEEEVEGRKQLRYGDVDKIVGRRKNARTIEYECTFIGQCAKDENKYISLEDMIAKGLEKLVQQADIRIAAIAAGLDLRPLINREIQSHLDDFNLEAEYGTHSNICRLSAGQKVKLVLAAAMWNKPHVIVLDEPTNYLDREALGALTQAIKEFPGAIVIISHHKEFTDSLCSEHWYVNNGVCVVEGEMDDQKPEKTIRSKSSKSSSKVDTGPDDSTSAGNTNSTKVKVEQLLNPKTLEVLTKVEIRKLTRCAAVAGMSLKDYVSRINKNSPEWQWLSNTIK
jgi:elongation factor 3